MTLARLIPAILLAPGVALAQDAPPPEEAAPEVGELFVSATQEGLPITLDGAETGQVTPAVIKDVPVGLHTVEIRQECAHYIADIQVKPLQIARVEAEPVEGVGVLRVTTEPSGVVVKLNDKVLGASPIEIVDVPCGEDLTLSAETDGYLTKARVIRVPAFATTDEHLSLEVESFGVLVIGVSPLDSDVYIDDELVARGPITLEQFPNGTHDLSVVREGFVPMDKVIYVSSEEVNRVDVSLEPGAPPAGWVTPGDEAPPEPVVTEPTVTEPAVTEATDVPATPDPVELDSNDGTSGTGGGGSMGRLILNGGVSAAGLVTLGVATNTYLGAREVYNNQFLTEPDDDIANALYETEIAPQQRSAAVQGVAGGLLLAGGAALWLTTDYTVLVTPRSASFGWRF